MNLVHTATYIQEAYREAYDESPDEPPMSYPIQRSVLRKVMIRCRGKINPTTAEYLISLENSVPDSKGRVSC